MKGYRGKTVKSFRRKFIKSFPEIETNIIKWKKVLNYEVSRKLFKPKRKAEILRGIYLYGGSFLKEAQKMKEQFAIHINRGVDTPIKISSEKRNANIALSFERILGKHDVVIESMQGNFTSLNENLLNKIDISGIVKDAGEIARKAGHNRIKIRMPQYSPFNEKNEKVIKKIWEINMLKEIIKRGLNIEIELGRLAAEGRPTKNELKETQAKYKLRIDSLYFTVAKKLGFNKREGEFLVKELK